MTNLFTQQTGAANPFNGIDVGDLSTPTFADIDGDGDLDAIVGEGHGILNYYKNTGSSTAPAYVVQTGTANPFNGIDVGYVSKPTFADLDGDGDLDAIVGANDGTLRYYKNTVSSTAPAYAVQTGAANPFNGIDIGIYSAPTFADIDGDGDLDAIVGSQDGTLRYFKNTGSSTAPAYVEQTGTANPFNGINVGTFSTPSFADLDGDSDLDAIVGTGGDGIIRYFKNTGSSTAPSLVEQTGTANPFNGIDVGIYSNPNFNGLNVSVGNWSAPILADLDGDGDLDALVGVQNGTLQYFQSVVPIAITPTGGNTQVSESGATDTYTVVLNGQPTADVVITLNGGTQLSTNVTTLTFTSTNWNVAQTVTVTAIDDTIGEGTHQGAITATSSSSDTRFNGVVIDSVPVTIGDNDLPTSPRLYVAQTGAANPFNSTDFGSSSTPTFADLDGDGDLDALIGQYGGGFKYYKNTGNRTAPVYTVQIGTDNPFNGIDVGLKSVPTFADLDGDGDLDAILGDYDGTIRYYKNTGSSTAPVYTAQTGTDNPFNSINIDTNSKPAFADLDGDGDLDAIVGTVGGTLKYYKNTGSSTAPVYTAQTGTANPFNGIDIGLYSAPTLADVDGDGDLDAIVGEKYGTLKYYKNTGSSTTPLYTAQTGTANPFNDIDVGLNSAPTFADLDGDGDLDAIVGERAGTLSYFESIPPSAIITLTGGNTQVTEGGATDTYTVVLSGKPTANVTIALNSGPQLSTNVTTLTFTTANWNVAQTVTVTAIDDPIGEGTQQGVITATSSSSDTRFNGVAIDSVQVTITDNDLPTSPRFYIAQTGTANPFNGIDVGYASVPTLADIDGDGDLDAIVGAGDGTIKYYKNTGSSNTAPVYTAQTGTANPFNGINAGYVSLPTFADIDGDGDLDAIVGANNGTVRYFKNTGSSTAPVYTEKTGTVNPFNGIDIGAYSRPTFADLDGDGDLDAIVGAQDGTLNYYQHTGSRTAPVYTAQTGTANPFNDINVGHFSTPTFADLDGDGDLDAIVGAQDGTVRYFKNTGSSTAPVYTEQTGTANPFNGIDIGGFSVPTFADLNGDGDLDAIFGADDGTIKYFQSNGSPTVTSGASASFAENGTGTAYTVTATDPDAGTTLTYSISGTDAALFNINSSTGAITFITAPNFEAPTDNGANNVYDLNVIVSDGSLTDTKAVAISVTNVNEAPTVTSGASASFAENRTGTVYTVTATDPDAGTTLTYSISGTDAALFNINSSTGAVTFKTARNFEAPTDNGANNIYDINVIASDGSLTNTKAVAITVTNVNESPTVTSGASANFAENGTGTAYTITGTDPDAGTTLTYSISGTDAALFNINSSTGAVTFKTAPNFEEPTDNGVNNVYDLNVSASDGSFTNTKAVTISVTNVNEAPTVTSGASASFPENGTGTVYTVTGTDPDAGTTLTYNIDGTDAALFNINSSTGAVTFKTAPNFEAPTDNGANNVYDLNVIANDGSLTDTKAITISVTNVNEAPTVTSGASASFAENGIGTVYTVTGTDPDAGTTLTYSISGTDAALFNINSSTGAVTFKTAPNFVAPTDNGANNVYDINVIVSDGSLTNTKAVAITISKHLYIAQTGTANPLNGIDIGSFSAPTFADIDGDDDLDAIVGGYDGTLKYYQNTGSSTAPFYTEQTGAANPFNSIDVGGYSAPTFADIDGDGDLDAIFGAKDGTLKYYKNTGSNTAPAYTEQTGTASPFNGIDIGYNSSPTFADIDGDGDLDAIVGAGDGTIKYYKNTGSSTAPAYIAQTGTANPFNGINVKVGLVGGYNAPTFADIDGDRDLDAIVGALDGTLRYYQNTGSSTAPVYTAQTGTANPFNGIDIGALSSPTFADIDGDGDFDAIVGAFDGTLQYFQSVPASAIITQTGGNTQVSEGGATDTYTVVLNGQPTADVTIALNGGTQLSTNVPTLTFTSTNWNVAQTVTVTAIDDTLGEGPHRGAILATSSSSDSRFNAIAINAVPVTITDNDLPTIPRVYTAQMGTANPFNGIKVEGYINSLTGLYVGGASAPTLADIDGDGDLDAIIGEVLGTLKYYKNTGSATAPVYTAQTGTANPFNGINVGGYSAPTLADLDGDGDLDAIIGASDGTLKYYKNTGSRTAPTYTAQTGTANPFNGIDIGLQSAPTLADIDSDGDLDAIVGEIGGTLRYVKNTGSNTAPIYIAQTETVNPFNGINVGNNSKPTFADIDGDGDLDAIVGSQDGTLYYYKNTGSTTAPVYIAQAGAANPFNGINVGYRSTPTFADLDGDGDLDAIVGATDGTLYYFQSNGFPTVTSGATVSLAENAIGTVYTVTATDPDVGNILTYSISGTDATLFNINSSTGAITFKTAPNFEAPTDSGADNVYDINVIASDGSLTNTKAVAITVTDVNEFGVTPPIDSNGTANSIAENAANGALVGITANAIDADGTNNSVTYSLTDNAGGRFAIDATTGIVTVANGSLLDYENAASHTITVKTTSSDNSFASQTFAIALNNLSEPVTTPLYVAQTGTANPLNGINIGYFSTPIFADLDGDSDHDAIVGETYGTLKYYKNTGSSTAPVYTAQTGTANPFNGIDVGDLSKPTLADLDGDGDLDAIVGAGDGTLKYYKNTGSSMAPVYTAQTGTANPFNSIDIGNESAPTFADLDGDSDLDAIVGASNGTLHYFKNTGSTTAPVYTAQTGTANPFNGINIGNYSTPTFADIDGDGDLDAIAGTIDSTVKYFKNTGSSTAPSFVVQTSLANPFNGINVGNNSAPTFADIDGDGDLDAIVGAYDGTLYYFQSNAAPTVTSGTTASFAENDTTTVYTVTGSDPDALSTLNYSISGTDATLFDINSTTGAVTFKTSPDFEAPTDSGANNIYDINVTASDGFLFDSKALAIAVTDVAGNLSVNNVSITEGNTGSTNAAFTVSLTDPYAGTVSVNYATTDGTAYSTTNDYTAINSGTLTFTGGVTTQTVNVTVLGDTYNENNETFKLNLSNPTNATLGNTFGTATIIDDDPLPTFSISSLQLAEGDSGSKNAQLNVQLSSASGQIVTVNYTTVNGTATSGSDYTATSGILSFAAGNTLSSIFIPILSDTTVESDETFTVTLSNPSAGATIAQGTGTVTILNDDSAGGALNLTLTGTSGNDILTGGLGNDIITGFAGNDTLDGAAGDDTITGGAGADILTGGLGGDRFVYTNFSDSLFTSITPNNSYDRIRDFNFGQGDRIVLSGLPSSVFNAGLISAANLTAAVTAAYADADPTTLGAQALGANSAVFFSFGTTAATRRTYVSVNDGAAGFNAGSDLFVEVTSMVGTLPTGSLTPNSYFAT